ncbi:ATP-dependent RNA helicase HrpA [Naasia lichenicola]|uniref:ATP-dependent RNA helicase HrpA n=1 Tax=Naasia lichenicola TaxID=2565933 RepID=A0A4S4FIS3_9MICO|nr:ATP-dependent RNA helicase HrpA [Naasia lichenicola]THG30159.1 ATP-dependent RNA helicase HrpA [Naasia lichenicola]
MSTDELQISYPPDLPVSQVRGEIAEQIRDHQVVIVAGETGSGKTTQLPKIALELGRTSIAHTQPRRIAARTIAERIADELNVELGTLVGYQVRFTDKASESTRIKLMTDGILLNELTRDPLLRRYDTIIIDEAHERSLTIDFLIGYLRQLLPKRPDLKVIITSATIDPGSFAAHFAAPDGTPAPIVEVSGRTFPVEIRYRPLAPDKDPDSDAPSPEPRDLLEAIGAALDELAGQAPGDVLVFLSGENEIRDAQDALSGRSGTEIVPLYGRLSAADQHRVFETKRPPGVRRRVVLATNVAETSLTVPGIKYVIDAGTARISRYGARSKVQRLPIEPISQASANQRSGRAGRTSDGIAIRLYSEEDYGKRPAFTDPEILRTGLAAVILQMLTLGLGDMADFPFLQPPDARGIKDGFELLREIGAVTAAGSVTKTGRDLSRLPLDPRFGRMVVESKKHGVSREVLAIVSGLSIQDPRERPLERRAQADEKHARFADPTSDFLSILNLWNHLEEKQKELSSSAFRRLCKAEFLNYLRVREWADVYSQLRRTAKPLGLTIGEPKADPDGVHRSVLAGLLSQLGVLDERTAPPRGTNARTPGAKPPPGRRPSAEYIGARQVKFAVFPGSALAKKAPTAVMAAELVETSRLFARTVAAIDPAWAEQLAGDLVKRSTSEPHWEAKQGAAVGWERVTLYGVPLVARRRIQWTRIDRGFSRELFIRHALVDGEWPPHLDRSRDRAFDFERANLRLRRELEALEERSRRRDILADDEALVDFFDERIPESVATVREFETWWAQARTRTPNLLTLRSADLLDEPAQQDTTAYPAEWRQQDQTLKLRYRFEPGSDDDGVTIQVPLAVLPQLEPTGFDWQVPGFRAELVTALIRTLPKAIRRTVVPAADWAERLLAELPAEPDGELLVDRLAAAIRRSTGAVVSGSDFELERVPPHLRPTFAVIDDNGRRVGGGKELTALKLQFAAAARDSVARVFRTTSTPTKGATTGASVPSAPTAPGAAAPGSASALERDGLIAWDFESLPQSVDVERRGGRIRAYPALVDTGAAVAIRLESSPESQAAAHRAGIRRLLGLAVPSPVSYLQEHLTSAEKLTLAASPYRSARELIDDAFAAVLDHRIRRHSADGLVWTRTDFETVRDDVSAHVVDDLFAAVALVAGILTAARGVESAIRGATTLALIGPLGDVREQLGGLVFPGFISTIGLGRLPRLPVYLAGMTHRVQKLLENPGRDRVWQNEVRTAQDRYLAAGGTIPLARDADPRLVEPRWMLEELRLSLFAQQLRTTGPVSLQRILKALPPV